jgi:hypothetical protein
MDASSLAKAESYQTECVIQIKTLLLPGDAGQEGKSGCGSVQEFLSGL